MADMRECWLIGFQDGEYVVYEREDDSEYGVASAGLRIGHGSVLADALEMADRWERVQVIRGQQEERERKFRWDAMSPVEQQAEIVRTERGRYMLTLMEKVMPSLPAFGRQAGIAVSPGKKSISWRRAFGADVVDARAD